MTPTEQSILRGVTPALTLTGATETLNHTEFYTADQLLAAVRETVEACAAYLEYLDGHGEWHEAAQVLRERFGPTAPQGDANPQPEDTTP